jgi:uncharacterized membrane protein YfcA
MTAAAAALGLLIGVVIGGFGGGGGVLTVPVLVYVLGQTAQGATTSSLLIVGVTAVVGTIARVRSHLVDWRTGLTFGAVGIPAAYLGVLLNERVAQPVLLLSFAGLTLAAAAALLVNSRRCSAEPVQDATDVPYPVDQGTGGLLTAQPTRTRGRLGTATTVTACGLTVGFLTGFLGVGGGFLVVPALVIALQMPMNLAVGTSLMIITLNAASSLAPRLATATIAWEVVVPFAVGAIMGSLIGKRIADRLSGIALARAFAVMLATVGTFVAVESIMVLCTRAI